MPIYEYECSSCGYVFEEWQKGFEERTISCPKCNSSAKRLISNTAFILKGSGWYVTDYGYKSSKNGDGKKGTDKPKEQSKSSETTSTSTSASTST